MGFFFNLESHYCLAGVEIGQMLMWVAVRGGIDDWAMYVGFPNEGVTEIADHGMKLSVSEAHYFLSGTQEFFKRYRS